MNLTSNPPPPNTECKYSERSHAPTPLRKQVYEWSVAIGTTGLLVVNMFLACSTRKAANAAKESADLTKHVLKGADAAKIRILRIVGTDASPGDFTMAIDNEGKLGTEKVEGNFGVSLISLPTNQIIETLPGFKFGPIPLFPDSDRQDVVHQSAFRIQDFERHTRSIEGLQEAFVVKGTFTYDDGLGEQVIDTNACQQVVPQVNRPLEWSFVDCGRVPEFLSDYRRLSGKK